MVAATALRVERRMVLESFRAPPVAACGICALPSRGPSAPQRPPSHSHRAIAAAAASLPWRLVEPARDLADEIDHLDRLGDVVVHAGG